MKTGLIFFQLIFFISFNSIVAQDRDSIANPKVGLVLSGGAAKGLAHIGVIKVLEEVGIIPDYITGTSMGAVVGGLYALGYSAEEISELNTNADWDQLLSDRIPLNQVIYEEKYEYKRYITGIPIRNYKFKLPSGVIEGQQLEKFFAALMWPLPKQESFDSLPIPFHCMGVDLISGKPIEFDSGNLQQCIRASMSIPSIFTPESIDTMLFVDGGVIRNFPVEEVIGMGADIVIGIYVGFDEEVTKEDLFSLSDVLSRVTVFYGIFDSKKQMEYTDILILPDLNGLAGSDFGKSKRIESLGESAAQEIKNKLYDLVDSLNLKYRAVEKIDQPEKIFIKEIEVNSDRDFVTDRFIINRSGLKENSSVSKHDLSDAVDKIFGTQYFSKVTYSFELIDNEASHRLIFNVKERTRAFLNFAAHYDNQYGPGLITNLTLRNYLAPASRATATLNIAENPGFRLDINKYLGKNQRIMGDVFINWNQNKNSLYDEGMNVGSYRLNYFNAGVGAKYSVSINQQIGVLGYYEISKTKPNDNIRNFYQVPSFEDYGYKGFAYKLYYNVNTTDDNFFPERGVKLDVGYKYNFEPEINYSGNESDKAVLNDMGFFSTNQDNFYTAYLNFDLYKNLYNRVTFNAGLSGGISSDESMILSNYVLGGYHWDRRYNYVPFTGLSFAEFVAPNFGLLKVGVDIEVISRIYLTASANMGFYTQSMGDYLEFIQSSSLNSYMKGYCVGVRGNTFVGPITVMYGDNDYDDKIRWYISIGYPF